MSNEQTAIRLPLWAELPHLSLHLDQLLDITNMYLEPIIGDAITKTMMHNYFKAGIIIPPVKKKIFSKTRCGCNRRRVTEKRFYAGRDQTGTSLDSL